MSRPRGRPADACRDITALIEDLDRVDGSARFGFGNAMALVSVSGPIEARLGTELPSKAALELNVRPLSGIPGIQEKALATTMRVIFTQAILVNHHPRTLIQFVFQSLTPPLPRTSRTTGSNTSANNSQNNLFQFSISTTAALINAGSLTLLQASAIPLVGVVTAIAIGIKDTTNTPGGSRTILVDPEDSELDGLAAGGVFAFIFSQKRDRDRSSGDDMGSGSGSGSTADMNTDIDAVLVWSSWEGDYRLGEFEKAETQARVSSDRIHKTFRSVMSGETDQEDEPMETA